MRKRLERYFVEEAAKRLGKSWDIGPDREHPDFVVVEGVYRFGLEVCEIFTGQEDRRGSVTKRGESDRQRRIEAIRLGYEAAENNPLIVKFVGDMCIEDASRVVSALVVSDFSAKPIGHQAVVDIENGLGGTLRMHVTKGRRADWFCMTDRIGWVDQDPIRYIEAMCGKEI